MAPDLGIIADDLSGANDTGLQFAKLGRRTVVLFERPAGGADAAVLVLDTDSRQAPPAEAAARVRAACRDLLAAGARQIYKKVDSTLRGNLGAEVDALLDELPGAAALLAPAFPANGRTVVGGRLLVREVPLDATEFALDPVWPAATARVAEVLARQSRRRVGEVGLAVVRQGWEAVAAAAEALRASGAEVVVVDAATPADLAAIAEVVAAGGGRWAPVGSAGLAEALAEALGMGTPVGAETVQMVEGGVAPARDAGRRPDAPPTWPSRARGNDDALYPRARGVGEGAHVLVVVGSANPVSRRQLAALVERGGVTLASLAVEPLLAGRGDAEREIERAIGALRSALREGDAALALGDEADVAGGLDRAGRLAAGEMAARLARAVGDAVARLLAEVSPAGLVLTGGDTAKAVCRALGAHGILVEREVLPGIPQGRLLGGAREGLTVVTKAGGFGGPEALVVAVSFSRRVTT